MKPFIHDDFLLGSGPAKELYHNFAKDEPIFDYHCHLSPKDLAENRVFNNLYEIWLEGDHYKWRAMRLHGLGEQFCTGSASPREKFMAFAEMIPFALRNPLYHWTHLELARYFGIGELLSPKSADRIWDQANAQLCTKELSSWGILETRKVKFIGTTDDPTDDLQYHAKLKNSDCPARVVPSFRPDKALVLTDLTAWNQWVDQLEKASAQSVDSLATMKDALLQRIDFFASMGASIADHGMARCPKEIASEQQAALIFEKARTSQTITDSEVESFAGYLLVFLASAYHERNWVMQFHLGAIRNVNGQMFKDFGPDAGCDSIGDEQQVNALAVILKELSLRNSLPKTILYNLNPTQNYAFATMCGNFFEEGVPAKVQFGSGWWFLDQAEGMRMQMNTLSNLGLLSHFVGMLTDSRSMMSFPRHEYFRRLLCQLFGDDVQNGVVPNDIEHIGKIVRAICYSNASRYFNF